MDPKTYSNSLLTSVSILESLMFVYILSHHNDRYLSLYVFQNAQNVCQEWERTVMWTMDAGWLWWVNVTYQLNKCTTLVGDVDNEETMHVWGQGYIGNLYPPFNLLWTLNYSKKVKS